MLNRRAVILSLGMLLKVDTNPLIAKLVGRAKEENRGFEFTPEIQSKTFDLSEQFNIGKLKPKQFATQALTLLNIKSISVESFLLEWNNIVDADGLSGKIKFLQSQAAENQILFYLKSDTNSAHLKKIAEKATVQGVSFQLDENPVLIEQTPLYASCKQGINRLELIQKIVSDIHAKKTNKPDSITLIYANPVNIKYPAHRAMAEQELIMLNAWCKENGVSIKLQNETVERTIEQIFDSGIEATIKPTK